MNFTAIAFSVILPFLVAGAAVPLALACKRHPMSRAVIIPEGYSKKAAAVAGPKASDLDDRGKLLATVVISLGIVLALSLVLILMTHLEILDFILVPLAALIDMLGPNVVIIGFVLFVLLAQVPNVAACLTWMTPRRGLLVALVCIAVFLSWILVDSWVTYDLMAILIFTLVALIMQQRISFLRLSLILLIAAVLYDAWQVYGTGNMVEYAEASLPVIGATERQMNYPAMFLMPSELSLDPQGYGLLGGGDVIVFSIMAIAAARFGRKVGSWVPIGLVFAGFMAAIVACGLIGTYFDAPQPATIYIVPLCAAPVLVYAKLKGVYGQLSLPFYDRPPRPEPKQAQANKES